MDEDPVDDADSLSYRKERSLRIETCQEKRAGYTSSVNDRQSRSMAGQGRLSEGESLDRLRVYASIFG